MSDKNKKHYIKHLGSNLETAMENWDKSAYENTLKEIEKASSNNEYFDVEKPNKSKKQAIKTIVKHLPKNKELLGKALDVVVNVGSDNQDIATFAIEKLSEVEKSESIDALGKINNKIIHAKGPNGMVFGVDEFEEKGALLEKSANAMTNIATKTKEPVDYAKASSYMLSLPLGDFSNLDKALLENQPKVARSQENANRCLENFDVLFADEKISGTDYVKAVSDLSKVAPKKAVVFSLKNVIRKSDNKALKMAGKALNDISGSKILDNSIDELSRNAKTNPEKFAILANCGADKQKAMNAIENSPSDKKNLVSAYASFDEFSKEMGEKVVALSNDYDTPSFTMKVLAEKQKGAASSEVEKTIKTVTENRMENGLIGNKEKDKSDKLEFLGFAKKALDANTSGLKPEFLPELASQLHELPSYIETMYRGNDNYISSLKKTVEKGKDNNETNKKVPKTLLGKMLKGGKSK